MPADQPRGPNRAWKNQAAAPGPASPGKRAWQKAQDAPTGPKRPWSKKSKLGLATFALSAIIALMIGVILYLRPAKPACLVLIGAGFEEELAVPHNVYGWKGLEDLAALVNARGADSWLPWSGSGPLRLQSGPREYDPKQPWVPKSFGEETVVVFLALHGGSDRKGAYLVVNDAGPRRVTLDQILDDFAVPELKTKKKVLILDATQVAAHWPGGLLHNDFTRKLKELDKRIEQIDNLVVLCASDVDQRSWVSEEWRQTIFTHFVIEGLKGAADSDGNSRVTCLELYQYVRERVQAWAEINREAVQSPILLPTRGGEERARGMELVQNPEPYREAEWDKDKESKGRFEALSTTLSEQLPPEWKEWSYLRTQVPSPAVYTPHLWRRYQDTLVRYEQLLRAGDPTRKAGSLRNSLIRLKDRIVAARRLEHLTDSVANTLPMPAEVGLTGPWPRDELQAQFKELAKPEKRQETWTKLKDWARGQGDAKDESINRKLLQVDLTRLVLEKAVQGQAASRQDLDKATELLRVVEGLGGPRPVEAHFLVMLLRDLDPDPKAQAPAADLRQALELCLLAENTAAGRTSRAEQAHPYSEFVLPWIDTAIVKADQRRRHGQDLLFGPGAKWDESRGDIKEAKKAYQKAGTDAEVVRQALDIRDQVLATLPYYARWLAMQGEAGAAGADALPVRELLTRVEEVARGVDGLAGPLEAAERRAKDLDTLKSLTEEVKSNFAYLTSVFDQASQQLSKQQEHQLRYLPRFEAALAVPLIEDPGLRMVLLGKSRELSAVFNAKFNPASKSNKPADDVALANDALESAKRQGRMAVAVTGLAERWLDAGNAPPIRGMVNNLQRGQWHDDLAMVGEGIAARYQQMRERIDKGRKESVEAKKLETAAAKIQGPEYLCRLIDGGQVPSDPVEPFDAVEGSRRLRFHDLLLWQTQRTLDDHWFKGSANPTETYYEPAAKAYVKDAEAMAEAGSDEDRNKSRQTAVVTMRRTIVPALLAADGPLNQHVTSEREFRVAWKVNAPKGMPGGVPVFWLQVDGPVKPLQSADLGRKALVDPLPTELAYTLQKVGETKEKDPSLVPQVQEAKAMLRGVFRGQRIGPDTTLYLHKAAEIVVYKTPPPDAAGVSLRLDRGFSYGAVSIVLDCSGSMEEKIGGKKKIDLARQALAQMLRKVPKGTYLSIAAFGQDPQLLVPPKNQLEATKIKWVRKVDTWDPEDLDDGIDAQVARLNRLVPQNLSPIAESLKFAKEEGFPSENKYKGPRVILALTDGDDNLFEEGYSVKDTNAALFKAELFAQGTKVPKFLEKEFRDSGIEINVICFADKNSKIKAAKEEAENAERQFGGVKDLDPPGRLLLLPDPAALEKALEQAIRPRLRMLQGGKTARRFPPDGLVATAYGDNLQWQPIGPGFYNGRVQNIYRQDIELERGQLLNITLKRDGRQVLFERGLLYDFVKDAVGARAKGDWHLERDAWHVSVAQNQFVQANGLLRQLVAIETAQRAQVNQAAGVPLQQVEPKFVWMELKAQGAKKPQSFLWHNEFGFGAPTFHLSAPLWPSPAGDPAAAELDVWWSENPTPGESRSVTHAPGPLAGLQGQTVNLAGNRVTLTTIKADRNRSVTVATEGDIHKQAMKPCLVVEIDHEAGKSVWVRADGLGQQGEEHLFYTSSGKYTAIFWGVSNPEDKAFQLTVISLDDFKKTAATNRHALFRLSPPDPVDNGPQRTSLKTLE